MCNVVPPPPSVDLLRGRHRIRSVGPLNSWFFRSPHQWKPILPSISPCCSCHFRLFLLFYYMNNSLPVNTVPMPAPKFTLPRKKWFTTMEHILHLWGQLLLIYYYIPDLVFWHKYREVLLFYLCVICKQSSSFLVARLLTVCVPIKTFLNSFVWMATMCFEGSYICWTEHSVFYVMVRLLTLCLCFNIFWYSNCSRLCWE
jgi:hypothetical protein